MTWRISDTTIEDELKPFEENGFDSAKLAKFTQIAEMFEDQSQVDLYLAKLEAAVLQKELALRDVVTNEDKRWSQALYDILRESEDAAGFDKTQVWYLEGVVSADQFFEMMRGPIAFMDPNVTPKHGAETHRIQWWMVGELLGAAEGGPLFSSTADPKASSGDSSEDTLWYKVFDYQSHGANIDGTLNGTARSPEFLKQHLSVMNYSSLVKAEEGSMSWTNGAKNRSHKITRFESKYEVKKKKKLT
ncbi:MAG: hypothetical protein HKN21_06685 [Candidatus Eisenbacteria bacterium]|uniref:DUF5636 domain-containing protein n=1 Tax=Eiseniibacteriota bacterium TaxID=2212470 RepID=A0A7Y2EAQ6_UNCEI|nr:hypothetical protein [Candidatus Eisenbacteria bacterium]